MEGPDQLAAPGARVESAFGPSMLYWFGLFRRRWRLIAACAVICGVLAIFVGLILPPTYVATVILVEAPNARSARGLELGGQASAQLGSLVGLAPSTAAIYPNIVTSRQLLARLLTTKFPTCSNPGGTILLEELRKPSPEPLRTELGLKTLRRMLDVALDRRTNVLTVRVRAKDAVLAAGIANAVGVLLQDFVIHSLATQGRQLRRFIEQRMAESSSDLSGAEAALRDFRQRNLRIGNSPRLLLEEGRLTREVRAREEVYVNLRREFEMAKIEEHRDTPVLSVIDPAVPPAFRNSPRRGVLVLGGLFFGLALGTILASGRRVVV